jgi:hypothetical protein
MRRSLAIATVVLILALVPAWSQHGGARASGGHSGFAAHGSMSGRGGSFGTMRSGHGGPVRGFNRGTSFHQPFGHPSTAHSFQHFHGTHHHNFALRTCFNCGHFFSPWGYAGYYDPYWWWDSGSSYDEDREREIAQASQMNQQSLEQQQRMRQDDQDTYSRADTTGQARPPERVEAPAPPTLLIFRDQRKMEVQNYAIVGQTLWNFSPQRTQKFPLSEIDLAATAKANDERGVDFHIPSAAEGQ